MNEMIKVYTDGACSLNGYEGAKGGWAYVLTNNTGSEIFSTSSGHLENATNNICELTALINGCAAAAKYNTSKRIYVYSDSAYCINCYEQKWYKKWQQTGWRTASKQPVKNRELWEKLIPYFENPQFFFFKVKGHADNEFNIMADRLAVAAKEGNCV